MRRRVRGVRRWRSVAALCAFGFVAACLSSGNAVAAPEPGCDDVPTGVRTEDFWLRFSTPPGLMPDVQFDGRPAKLEVHRVSPVYAHGKCPGVPAHAAVLIHGRSVTGAVSFDLRQVSPAGGTLSTQEALARSGIDTFAPSLLGYGRSTGFDEGLKDPGNASLRPYLADGTCPYPEGCDRTHNAVFPLDQQGTLLAVNPLAGQRRAHSSNVRFARTDVWVRDIRPVIDGAIARARPTDGKVALIGYSLGAQRVARTLYAANPVLPGSGETIGKVSRTVFLAPAIYGGPTEETPPPAGFVTFPLTLRGVTASWPPMPADCTGHLIPGTIEQVAKQEREHETTGRDWGGTDPAQPTGLIRMPTFSSYGFNAGVVGQLTPPTLIIGGLNDTTPGSADPSAVFDALPASMTNKALVRLDCASHNLVWEGCDGPRCLPASGTPYGGTPGAAWEGPHATITAALTEWITRGSFDGAGNGRFIVDKSGVASGDP